MSPDTLFSITVQFKKISLKYDSNLRAIVIISSQFVFVAVFAVFISRSSVTNLVLLVIDLQKEVFTFRFSARLFVE